MKERPILFSAPMVRAILDGRKTQTRRLAITKRSGIDFTGGGPKDGPDWNDPGCWGFEDGNTGISWALRGDADASQIACRHGQPGDRLWVRETWAQPAPLDPGPTVYRADYPDCVPAGFENIPPAGAIRWKPSIHMPRALSRITLEITDVRVERLQGISERDAIAEGICKTGSGFWSTYGQREVDGTFSPRSSFQSLWESINGLMSWESNPWVWVIEFRRITDVGSGY